MIIGHLPAGYLLARALKARKAVFWAVLAGSVLPDLDMAWFHLVDGGAVHHHEYITHRPIVWMVLLLAGVLLRNPVVMGFGGGAVLHVMLDSIAGHINWGWPFFDWSVTLVVVPTTQNHWVLSFMVHWTFAVEIAVLLLACFMLVRGRKV